MVAADQPRGPDGPPGPPWPAPRVARSIPRPPPTPRRRTHLDGRAELVLAVALPEELREDLQLVVRPGPGPGRPRLRPRHAAARRARLLPRESRVASSALRKCDGGQKDPHPRRVQHRRVHRRAAARAAWVKQGSLPRPATPRPGPVPAPRAPATERSWPKVRPSSQCDGGGQKTLIHAVARKDGRRAASIFPNRETGRGTPRARPRGGPGLIQKLALNAWFATGVNL